MYIQSCDDCIFKGLCNLNYKYEGMKDYIWKFVRGEEQDFTCSFMCKHFKARCPINEKKDS